MYTIEITTDKGEQLIILTGDKRLLFEMDQTI